MPLKRAKNSGDEKKNSSDRKERKRREVEERKITLRKDHLDREIKLGNLTTKRNKRAWRDMMMKIKMPILREELEVAWHTFDRSIDIKDYSTSLILDAMDQAEEQYQRNLQSHLEIIDRLLRIYGARLREQKYRYENELKELLGTSNNDTDQINYNQTEDEIKLQSMIFNTNQHLQELAINFESSTIAKVNSLRDDNKNARRQSAAILEQQLTVHWHALLTILNDYENETKERRRVYEIIKAKDDRERGIIARQVVKTANLFDSIRKLKEKIGEFKTSSDHRIHEIMNEYKFFHDAYTIAKQRFLTEQSRDKARLLIITKEYKLTMDHLKKLVKKGKVILLIVKDCNKYETQDEKILPFGTPVEIEEFDYRKASTIPDEVASRRVLGELQDLTLFWRRTGAADIITKELSIERTRLLQEKQCLCECLRHCLTQRYVQVSMNDDEMMTELRKHPPAIDTSEIPRQ